MANRYVLEWLDLLITVTLNPDKTEISAINDSQLKAIIARIDKEKNEIKSYLNEHVFSLINESDIKSLVNRHHSALIILLDDAFVNKKKVPAKKSLIKTVYEALIISLDELLSFIEVRFSKYLALEERVPATYLSVTKNELKKKVYAIRILTKPFVQLKPVCDLVFNRIYYFTNASVLNYEVTFRDILYKKELIKGLEEIRWDINGKEYTPLDELLIYLNFNSKAYMNLLTSGIANIVNESENPIIRMDKLLLYYKAFNQLHRKPEVALNPKYHSLETIISNWFVQEIIYLEKKMHLSVTPLGGKAETTKSSSNSVKEKQKVLCILSSDQTGLILRAADELRILIAKSMSEVFKTIVPHLSTPYKDDLSYDGMRSKSYVAEERDKQIAIETLEKIIKKISDY